MFVRLDLLAHQVIGAPNQLSATQNLVYLLIVIGTVIVTLGVVGIIRAIQHRLPKNAPKATKAVEIQLVFEETLSAAERAVVRDQQVREAVQYLRKDPILAQPLQEWREKRREWAGEMAFLETLGKMPSAETLRNPNISENLRHLHSLVLELESAQRAMLRAVRQSIATGSENPPLGTETIEDE